MSLAILFHFLCAQHVSGINISIIRSLRLFCWIITLVVLFLARCVLEFRCGWVGVVSVLQAETCNTDTTPTQPHRISNTHRNKNNTTNAVIQQNSRKLLMMDILMSETCWAHKKWNEIAIDIKLVFYSSTIHFNCQLFFKYYTFFDATYTLIRKTKCRFSVKTTILDYWADNVGSTQTIQIQWSFQLLYPKIIRFDKSNGTGLFTQVQGIWNYRSTFLPHLLLDPITLFFPASFSSFTFGRK